MPKVLMGLLVLVTSCSSVTGVGDTTEPRETTKASTAVTLMSPSGASTTTTSTSTTSTSIPWSTDSIPPEGVAAQLSLSGLPLLNVPCAVRLDGPGAPLDVIELPEDLETRIRYGFLLSLSELGGLIDDYVIDISSSSPLRLDSGAPFATLPLLPPVQEIEVQPPPADLTGEVGVLDRALLCGSGWDPGSNVELSIEDTTSAPAGAESVVIGDEGSITVLWSPEPGRDLGPYSVLATTADQTVTANVEVVPSGVKLVKVLGSHEGHPGADFRVGVAGFEPGGEVSLHAYLLTSGEGSPQVWEYVGSTNGTAVGGDGGAVFEVATNPAQTPGAYCFIADTMSYSLLVQCSDAGIVLLDE